MLHVIKLADNFGCNCDVMDGVTRNDFGMIVEKDDLPVGSVTFNGDDTNGTISIGVLRCAGREFGRWIRKGNSLLYSN